MGELGNNDSKLDISKSSDDGSTGQRFFSKVDANFEKYLLAATAQSFLPWAQQNTTIHCPMELPGVNLGRRLLIANLTKAEAVVLHFRFHKADLMTLFDGLWLGMDVGTSGRHTQQNYSSTVLHNSF